MPLVFHNNMIAPEFSWKSMLVVLIPCNTIKHLDMYSLLHLIDTETLLYRKGPLSPRVLSEIFSMLYIEEPFAIKSSSSQISKPMLSM